MRADIAEAVSVWERAGYRVKSVAVNYAGRPWYSARIWPAGYTGGTPHNWEPNHVHTRDLHTTEDSALLEVLRAAAALWEGVV